MTDRLAVTDRALRPTTAARKAAAALVDRRLAQGMSAAMVRHYTATVTQIDAARKAQERRE